MEHFPGADLGHAGEQRSVEHPVRLVCPADADHVGARGGDGDDQRAVVKTTLDGLGRTLKVETGDGTGTKSVVDYVYDSCGCSPTGKLKQQSLPHAPGAAAVWTVYTYDGLGRTVSVQAPDGASATTYSYLANTVTPRKPHLPISISICSGFAAAGEESMERLS